MSKRRLKSIESEITAMRNAFTTNVEQYAEEYRLQVLLPLCRMKKLTFLSGNGSWSFYDRDGNPVREYDRGFKYLEPFEHELGVEVLGNFLLGHYTQDVRATDY